MNSVVARLVPVVDADNMARTPIELRIGVTSVGRSSDNVLILTDPEVSKRHAEIWRRGNEITVRDLSSSNGTYVNGALVREHKLQPGDIVEFGSHTYAYETQETDEDSFAGLPQTVTILPQRPTDQTLLLAVRDIEPEFPLTSAIKRPEMAAVYERLRTAFTAVQELVDIRDLKPLSEKILEVGLKLVPAENGAVLLFNEEGELRPWATRIKGSTTERLVVSRTIIDEVVNNKRAVIASDAISDQRWSSSESLMLSGVRSLLCVPLLNAQKVFGVLHLACASRAAAFTENDLDLLTGVATGAGVALSNALLTQRLATEERHRASLGRFLAPQLVEQVLAQKLDLERSGDERMVTVLFADIRGFTALTERSEASHVVQLLNEYFDCMTEVVFAHHGLLDKFIGDAVMAVWGTPVHDDLDPRRALDAALEMLRELRALNLVRKGRAEEEIGVGIGLATGICIAGAIGARRRLEYTVIGDAVNVASRLAGIAKAGEVLFDENTFASAGRPARAEGLPETRVKGREGMVSAFRLTLIHDMDITGASKRGDDA